ncbi:MAG: hypothetical protein EXS27_03830 [Pedosphaera sp.]|nr:hypothetical protein [Pedosphaera sp.]
MESAATKTTAPDASQPFSFGGVAAFARAPFGRLLVAQLVTAAAVAGCVVWLLARQWCPVIETAISQLPSERAIVHEGQLVWPAREANVLAETHFLAVVVSPREADDTGQTADLQLEFGKSQFRISSLFGYLAWPYPEDRQLPLTRGAVEPWWGAWKPILLAGVATGTLLWLLFTWTVLAMLGTFIVRLVAFFADRESTRAGRWKLAAAALLPGAWIFAMGLVLYGLEWLPLLGLLLVTAVHLVVGWIYLFFAPFFLPRVPSQFATVANPFTTAPASDEMPKSNPFTGDETLVKPLSASPPNATPGLSPAVPETIPTPTAAEASTPASANPFSTPDAAAGNPFDNAGAAQPAKNPFTREPGH